MTLEQGVKAFQERHGLTSDGAIGPGTRAAMNVSVAHRIDQIRVNLERGRWTLHEMKGEFVLVDVAGFYVSYFRNDEPIWTSRVVVGKDQRETPIFRSKITYVVFNPTWTIPPGILVKDKLPVLRRNPGALKAMNIRVLDGSGREVNPYSVNWNQYGPSRLPPYQFVQDPGPNNALGLVKVMFPNPYLVYLHDSPAKSLYEQDQRTFSSGCIRVQKPFELAAARAQRSAMESAEHRRRDRDEADPDGQPQDARAGADPVLDCAAAAGWPGELPQRCLRARSTDAGGTQQRLPPAGPQLTHKRRPANLAVAGQIFTQEEKRTRDRLLLALDCRFRDLRRSIGEND